MWNVLDFALGYYQARQQAENVMVAEEVRRRVIQSILQDVRYAYYRAAGTKELLDEMDGLLRRARSAYVQSKKVSYQKLRPMVETMTYQRELLDNIRILWGLIRTLATAKTELATLMNVRPGSSFEVLPPGEQAIPAISGDMASLEEMAMQFRPELREEDYKARISALEVRKTIIGMLPGVNLSLGYNYDSNDLLYKKNWWAAGAEISMNLLNLISGPARYRAAKTRQEVDSIRRQAVGHGRDGPGPHRLSTIRPGHRGVRDHGRADDRGRGPDHPDDRGAGRRPCHRAGPDPDSHGRHGLQGAKSACLCRASERRRDRLHLPRHRPDAGYRGIPRREDPVRGPENILGGVADKGEPVNLSRESRND